MTEETTYDIRMECGHHDGPLPLGRDCGELHMKILGFYVQTPTCVLVVYSVLAKYNTCTRASPAPKEHLALRQK